MHLTGMHSCKVLELRTNRLIEHYHSTSVQVLTLRGRPDRLLCYVSALPWRRIDRRGTHAASPGRWNLQLPPANKKQKIMRNDFRIKRAFYISKFPFAFECTSHSNYHLAIHTQKYKCFYCEMSGQIAIQLFSIKKGVKISEQPDGNSAIHKSFSHSHSN